jgi:hypothetical protein
MCAENDWRDSAGSGPSQIAARHATPIAKNRA